MSCHIMSEVQKHVRAVVAPQVLWPWQQWCVLGKIAWCSHPSLCWFWIYIFPSCRLAASSRQEIPITLDLQLEGWRRDGLMPLNLMNLAWIWTCVANFSFQVTNCWITYTSYQELLLYSLEKIIYKENMNKSEYWKK